MNVPAIVAQLQKKYPGKLIIKNKNTDGVVTEIICEVEPTENHPDYSDIVAVIDSSILHVHKKATETYTVMKGELIVFMADRVVRLKKGDSFTMKPGEIHATLGDETWITVYAQPGWTLKDHIGLKPIVKEYLGDGSHVSQT